MRTAWERKWGGARAQAVAHLVGKEESGGGGNGSDAEKFEQSGGDFRLGFEGKGAAAMEVYMGGREGTYPARIGKIFGPIFVLFRVRS